MENKINIAELLKDCPSGMELYSPIFGELKFNEVNAINNRILVVQQNDYITEFESDGRLINCKNGECLLFPSKDQRDWSKFQRPFMDGDILISGLNSCEGNPFIFKQLNSFGNAKCYCAINCYGKLIFNSANWAFIKGCRFATEEEKTKLFDAIKDNGYKWNPETKTLEKLVEPKFKVGDKIQSVISSSYYTVVDIKNDLYFIKSDTEKYPYQVPFSNEINYKLAPNKFGITNLKPFDKVLVRHNKDNKWCCSFFSHIDKDLHSHCYKFVTTAGKSYPHCIPYEGNQKLRGTTNDCDEYFKTWG